MPLLNMRTAQLAKANTPRGSARSTGSGRAPFALSARHLLKPEVGLGASISAMGATPPVWNKGQSVLKNGSGGNGKNEPHFGGCDMQAPYNVGRQRARAQLKLGLMTEEETSQLRRLQQALDSNRFDKDVSRELDVAAMQARQLSRKFNDDDTYIDLLRPAPDPKEEDKKVKKKKAKEEAKATEASDAPVAAEAEGEEELNEEEILAQEHAALRIQAIQRGKEGRKIAAAKR